MTMSRKCVSSHGAPGVNITSHVCGKTKNGVDLCRILAQFQHLSKNIASVNIVNNNYDVLCRGYIIEEVSNV